jgi:hypothetical protein
VIVDGQTVNLRVLERQLRLWGGGGGLKINIVPVYAMKACG